VGFNIGRCAVSVEHGPFPRTWAKIYIFSNFDLIQIRVGQP